MTLYNTSSINLVSMFRCSSPPVKQVYLRSISAFSLSYITLGEGQSETSCNHKQRTVAPEGSGSVSNRHRKKGLLETRRPGLISTMRADLSQSTHLIVPKDTLGGLKGGHLRDSDRRTESDTPVLYVSWFS
jgi:hypothetical protein